MKKILKQERRYMRVNAEGCGENNNLDHVVFSRAHCSL